MFRRFMGQSRLEINQRKQKWSVIYEEYTIFMISIEAALEMASKNR